MSEEIQPELAEAVAEQNDPVGASSTTPITVREAAEQLEDRTDGVSSQEQAEELYIEEDPVVKPRPEAHPARSQVQQAYGQLQNDVAQFQQEYGSVNWEELRRDDPAEYAALSQDYQKRQSELMQRDMMIQQSAQGIHQQEQQHNARKQAEYWQREEQAILKAFPSWHDPSVRRREGLAIREYLRGEGFSDAEISKIDHRAVKLARTAALHKQGKSEKPKSSNARKLRKKLQANRAPKESNWMAKADKYQRRILKESPNSVRATAIKLELKNMV